MLRKIALTASLALATSAGAVMAAGAPAELTDLHFAHEGPFGKFDQHQLQRGLQVYTEVCAACHGMKFVPIRSLSDKGGPEMPADQIRAYAAEFTVVDKETGEERPGKPTDHFPKSAVEGAPDLSLMTKARSGFHGPYGTGMSQLFNGIGGPEYVYSILTHFEPDPACAPDGIEGYYYNTAFPNGAVPDSCKDEHGLSKVSGSWIAMNPPLSDDQVTYADGTKATVAQMSEDVTAFMTWAAEPKMMDRKAAGFKAVFFLILLSTLLYLTNKKLWSGVKGKKQA